MFFTDFSSFLRLSLERLGSAEMTQREPGLEFRVYAAARRNRLKAGLRTKLHRFFNSRLRRWRRTRCRLRRRRRGSAPASHGGTGLLSCSCAKATKNSKPDRRLIQRDWSN